MGFLIYLGVLVGAAIGISSQQQEDEAYNAEAQATLSELEEEKTRELNYLDESFSLSKEKAGREADRQDLQTTVSEALAAGSLSGQMKSLSLNQAVFGENLNAAEMNAGAAYGSNLASLAASGTRAGSGSMSDAVDMQAAVNAAQLESQKNAGRKEAELDLTGVLGNLASTNFGLQQSRDDAAQLRADYEEGGLAYQDYMLRRKRMEAGYDAEAARIQRQVDSYNDPERRALRQIGAAFHGATTGASLTYNAAATGREEGWWNLA